MIRQFAEIASYAHDLGFSVVQFAYPRGPYINERYGKKEDYRVVMYSARVAVESSADMIKTYWTDSRETFAKMVEAAGGVPVLLSGGAKTKTPLISSSSSGRLSGQVVLERSSVETSSSARIRSPS